MPGRTWVIAPDAESLRRRWQTLVDAPASEKEKLFHPHLRGGKPGDKHSRKIVNQALPGFPARPVPVAEERGPSPEPVRYGFRSFDRQWIVADSRLINQPNPELWEIRSDRQVYLTALSRTSPSTGPALTVSAHIPDLDHYNGRGGRMFPLWRDREAKTPNIRPGVLAFLSAKLKLEVGAQDLLAYIVAVSAHPAFTTQFQDDLSTPGLRIPLTADGALFAEASELGRSIVWLQTFGERMNDPDRDRPAKPPRLPANRSPRIPKGGAIPESPDEMPDSIDYDTGRKRLLVGPGYIENVEPAVWNYEVSGKQVLLQWFSYRKANRDRPIIGDRRPPSPLGNIQPDHWLAEYTTELINLLNVLGRLVELEPIQAKLLDRICAGTTLSLDVLRAAGALELPAEPERKGRKPELPSLFE